MNNKSTSEPAGINWHDAVEPGVAKTALKIALIVGTLLGLINHGPALLAMTVTPAAWVQIGLTYLVPYGVSTYSSISNLAANRTKQP